MLNVPGFIGIIQNYSSLMCPLVLQLLFAADSDNNNGYTGEDQESNGDQETSVVTCLRC